MFNPGINETISNKWNLERVKLDYQDYTDIETFSSSYFHEFVKILF